MRTPVIAVWAAVLLTYGVSTGTAMDPAKAVAMVGASAGALTGIMTGASTGIMTGASAGASAGALTGIMTGASAGALTGIMTGASAGASAGALTGIMTGASAGIVTGALTGALTGAGAGAVFGVMVGASAGAGAVTGVVTGAVTGALTGAVAGPSAGADNILKLDMAPNSVDDMYQDCKDKMYQKLQELLANDKNQTPPFKAAWKSSENKYNKTFKKSKPALGKDRIVAIYYYTFGGENAYLDFNNAVRTQASEYKTTFGYHALHFLLTDAIQTLKERRLSNLAPGEDGCVTGYRRVDRTFDQVVNTQLLFGSFTSTSMGQYSNKVERFGDKTCFEIYTCFGVDVSMYSKFENEGEVLIPPYEVFKVVGVNKRSQYKDLPCEVEYKLKSRGVGTRRNLNCELLKD